MSYDEKFRRHVLKIKEQEGLSFAKVAKRFGIAKQTVYYWTKRLGVTYKKKPGASQSGPRKTICVLPRHSKT